MNTNRRKWNSMDRLEGTGVDDNNLLSPNNGSNLRSLKHLSVSSPGISIQDMDSEYAAEGHEIPGISHNDPDRLDGKMLLPLTPTTNKARQKKFDRQFSINEPVLEFYSCALALDILLHGILYVTNNNLAFYSNVFGKVTKVLIPVVSIEKIQKSKTALIIPNAIHVHTISEKYVFASFMSRENAYTQMQRVWHTLVARSCGSKMQIVEPFVGQEVTLRNKTKIQRVKSSPLNTPGTDQEKLKIPSKKSKKEEKVLRKSVVFVEEPESILQHGDDMVVKINVIPPPQLEISEDEYVTQESENSFETFGDDNRARSLQGVLRPVEAYQTIHSRSLPSGTQIIRPNSKSSSSKLLRWACYLLTLLLSLSAANLYVRIDAIIDENSQLRSVAPQQELLEDQTLLHAKMSFDFLERINETIKRLNTVHQVLEQFSKSYVLDENRMLHPIDGVVQ